MAKCESYNKLDQETHSIESDVHQQKLSNFISGVVAATDKIAEKKLDASDTLESEPRKDFHLNFKQLIKQYGLVCAKDPSHVYDSMTSDGFCTHPECHGIGFLIIGEERVPNNKLDVEGES